MIFAAIIEYVGNKEKIAEIRPRHREYLTSLLEKGQLVACGPFTDDSGALIVYDAETKDAVERLMQGDPFYQGGVFQNWKIRPWKPVMANRTLLPG